MVEQIARARDRDRPGARRASRRRDLPQLLSHAGRGDLRRDAAGRDRRLPRPLLPTATRSPPTPAKPPSRSNPANARTRSSGGRATSGYATRSASWRTAPRRWNPWAADRYASARARGHNHRRALRTLGRAWSRIIWRCWQTHTPYDPARHTGLQQHITVTIPTPSGPRPDLPATQRMAGAAVTRKGGPTGRARSA